MCTSSYARVFRMACFIQFFPTKTTYEPPVPVCATWTVHRTFLHCDRPNNIWRGLVPNWCLFCPVFAWCCIHKYSQKHMGLLGLRLMLVIHCLYISATGFCELFARQIGKKPPVGETDDKWVLVVRIAIQSRGDQLCVTNCIHSTVQSEYHTGWFSGILSLASVLFQVYTNISALKLHSRKHDLKNVTGYLIIRHPL